MNFLAGPIETDALKVEQSLESLWRSLSPSRGGAEARASVLNLVAVADSTSKANASAEVIARMIGRSPCRAILIDSQPETDPPGLKVEVSIIAEKEPYGSRQACCELISLSATGFSADGLPTAAIALYTADLPILLWWSSPPFEREDFKRFSSHSDRVIVDSREFGRDSLQDFANFIKHSRKVKTAVCDLNWARLTPYRQLFAQFFDSPQWLSQLEAIESVDIEGIDTTGLLLAGWLLSRLGNRISANKINLSVVENGERVFKSIKMKTLSGEFSVTRIDNEKVEAQAKVGAETVSRSARIPLASVDQLLADEIAFAGRDRAFDAAMEWASLIAPMY